MKQNPCTPFRSLEVRCIECGYNIKSPRIVVAGKYLCKKCKKKLKKERRNDN